MRSRWVFLSAGLVVSVAGLIECVGDSPVVGDSGPDATNDVLVSPETGSDASDASADADAGPNPSTLGVGHLRLWLTADRGLTCDTTSTPHRLSAWKDQSGKGNDGIMPPVAPQCQFHTINSVDVPYFSHPDSGTPYTAETVGVDLSFLANSSFTILVVDQLLNAVNGNTVTGLVGTAFFPETTNTGPNAGLNFGYILQGTYQIFADQNYNYLGAQDLGASPPTKPSIDILWFDPAVGHRFFRDGALGFEKLDAGGLQPLAYAANGAIGRAAWLSLYDARFYGYVAEVAVYDTALSDLDLAVLHDYAKAHWGL